jgi:hypothetical protein
MTMTPRENHLREEARVVAKNGENEANQLYRQFREWRSAGSEQ